MAVGIYMDVHIPRSVTNGLRLRGVIVVTAQEDGTATFDDSALLNRASELGMLLYTHDDDLLAEANEKIILGDHFTGVVFSHLLRSPIGRCIDDLELIAVSLDPLDLDSLVEFIPY
ncbi:MAG TPA: DUF5615 family PIN-like protein [Pyrinomonadaceae bacterium]|nr:DUF5615 family PIN-like protein [Pyrinomonadaceae bacterium]